MIREYFSKPSDRREAWRNVAGAVMTVAWVVFLTIGLLLTGE